jgi:hypothetical protein
MSDREKLIAILDVAANTCASRGIHTSDVLFLELAEALRALKKEFVDKSSEGPE